jgi:pimeloyl-ACP methyl ester carboxylesterase
MARQAAGPQDTVIDVGDGRRLGFATFGDPDGYPVVNCHGGLVSRNDCALADGAARDLGLRVISPDRPGIGLTDRVHHHDMVRWADTDLRALVDSLALDRFSVMGWSAGGQRALAAAHVLADRVDRAAVVAGCLPLDDDTNRAQLSALDRRLLRWSEHAPPLATGYIRLTHQLATRAPRRVVRMSAAQVEGAEHGALAERTDWYASTLAEATHDPVGQRDDYRTFGAPWGFRPEDVDTPVTIHHGTRDQLVPVAWADELARRLPHAAVTTYPGVGHLLPVTHADQILATLTPT